MSVAEWFQVIGVATVVPVLWLAYRQLRAATSAAEAEAVLALDQAFAQFEPLRDELRRASDDYPYVPRSEEERARLSRYLVVFERLGFLVSRRLIDEDRAIELYGFALTRLLTRSEAERMIRQDLDEAREPGSGHSQKRWQHLIRLWSALPDGPAVPGDIQRAHRRLLPRGR
jgi:hypothetical protein